LRERYRRLAKSTYPSFDANVSYFMDWLSRTPALKSLIDAIDRSDPSLDPDEWYASLQRRGQIEWPDSEVGRAKVVARLLRRIALGEVRGRDVGFLLP
jgi:hypothetical protein